MANNHAFTATYEILSFDRDGNPVEKIEKMMCIYTGKGRAYSWKNHA